MNSVIYVICFPDGNSYVGSTSNFSDRRRRHLRAALKDKYTTSSKLTVKLREHGICCIYVVASVFDKNDLHLVEAQVIETLRPTLNANIKPTKVHFHQDNVITGKPVGGYSSMLQCSKSLGVSRATLRKYGTLENYENAKAERKKSTSEKIKFGPPDPRGKSWLICSGAGWFNRSDVRVVGVNTYVKRRRAGWGEWDALTTPATEMGKIAKLCKKYGLTYQTYWQRKKKGANTLQALGILEFKTEVKMKKRTLTVGDKTRTIDAWAKEIGVTSQVIHQRIYNGWAPEEVVGIKLRPGAEKRKAKQPTRAPKQKPTYTYKGVTGTVTELARHFGEADSLIRSRLKRGYTIEEAFEMPLHWVKPRERKTDNESLSL